MFEMDQTHSVFLCFLKKTPKINDPPNDTNYKQRNPSPQLLLFCMYLFVLLNCFKTNCFPHFFSKHIFRLEHLGDFPVIFLPHERPACLLALFMISIFLPSLSSSPKITLLLLLTPWFCILLCKSCYKIQFLFSCREDFICLNSYPAVKGW